MDALDPSLIRMRRDLPPEQAVRAALVGARTISYGELGDAVGALSATLLGLPVQVGDRVAIWMDKQPRYVEAILASLDAGCAYVPLDGGQPPARVSTILADAEPVVLVTDRGRLAALVGAALPASVRAVIVADADADAVGTPAGPDGVRMLSWPEEGQGRSDLPEAAERDLAALLYTSGSTGTPKGVMISRRNLAEFVGWCRRELDVDAADVFANHASFNFDLSTFDLFVALSVGASVWVVEDAVARDPAALAAGIRGHGVTVWYSVPSILHQMVSSGALTAQTARTLRYVVFAGEIFPVPQLRPLAGLLSAATALYNFYGPTETNVCTYHRVGPADLLDDEPLPIGRPVGDVRLSVLDDAGQPTAPGAVGELVVEGSCVTPGYWRRAADPAAAEHRRGRHPTGDLVSRRDGVLHYHGRKDRMVKLSGYRVELDEVEAAVLRHDAVGAAAVVLADGPSGPRLALYYALRPGASRPSLLDLKRHCARLLPRYMLPQVATCVDDLPRLPNGKTDYRSLRSRTGEPALAGAGLRPGRGAAS